MDPTQTADTFPVTGLVTIGLLILTGIMLWASGRRGLRAGFALTGLFLGAAIGWIVGNAFNLAVSPWLVTLIGALLMACAGALAYRLVVAATLAVVLGTTLPVGLATAYELRDKSQETAVEEPVTEMADATLDEIDEFTGELSGQVSKLTDLEELKKQTEDLVSDVEGIIRGHSETTGLDSEEARSSLSAAFTEVMEQVRHQAQRGKDVVVEFWANTPTGLRPTLIVSALIGIVLGVMIGTIAPSLSAALVTAFGGSAMSLGGATILLDHWQHAPVGWLPQTPTMWLVLWIIVSIIGLAFQWLTRPRPADESA